MFRILIMFLLVVSTGCQNKPQVKKTTKFSGNGLMIAYHIIIGKNLSEAEQAEVQNAINETFEIVNDTYNKWNPHSEISQLNALKANVKMPISTEMHRLLKTTDELVALTNGRFDPTIEPVQKIWKDALKKCRIPSQESILEVAPAIGWQHVYFDHDGVSKDHDLTAIDLGGLSKGYTVDLLVEKLLALGLSSAYVEWGGEVRAIGRHPEDRPWKIMINNHTDTHSPHTMDFIELENQAIATSGEFTHWDVDGAVYFHVMDPHTMAPLTTTKEGIICSSVVAPTCVLADALATPAIMFGSAAEAVDWAEAIRDIISDVEFWMVTNDLQTIKVVNE